MRENLTEEAGIFLEQIEVPSKQQSMMCRYVLIALSHMANQTEWGQAENPWMGIHDIIVYLRDHNLRDYAENTRESIRKDCLRPFREMALIEDNGVANNNKNYKYRLTMEMLELLHNFQTEEWETALKYYRKYNTALIHSYQSKKELRKMPVRVNGQDLRFSPGKHNQLQKSVLEVFMPKFAKECVCLYVGDSSDRGLYKNNELLDNLGLHITFSMLPDVVLYDEGKKWLYFIECVTTVGPISEARKREFEELTKEVDADNIYVTAFQNLTTFKKRLRDLAWDTEVWISDMPDHMIHLNGDKFMGPRDQAK